MEHNDHVDLLRPAHLPAGGTWVDLGAGSGAFTLALRELVGAEAVIHAVDRNRAALKELQQAYQRRFGSTRNLLIHPMDFSGPLELPGLDGLLMANSLHFFKDKEKILRHVRTFLKPEGTLLLVEYNVDSGNWWVPYPLSFETFRALMPGLQFTQPRLLARHPSSFLHEFYSAAAFKSGI